MTISRAYFVGWMVLSFLLGAAGLKVFDGFAIGAQEQKKHRPSLMDTLCEELDLSDSQKGGLERILEESRKRMVALSRATQPQYQEIKMQTRDQIRAILSPEQVERFNQVMQERDDRKRHK